MTVRWSSIFGHLNFLIACYATLHTAMSVGLSIGWLVGWLVGWLAGRSPVHFFSVFELFSSLLLPNCLSLLVFIHGGCWIKSNNFLSFHTSINSISLCWAVYCPILCCHFFLSSFLVLGGNSKFPISHFSICLISSACVNVHFSSTFSCVSRSVGWSDSHDRFHRCHRAVNS